MGVGVGVGVGVSLQLTCSRIRFSLGGSWCGGIAF